MEYKIILWLVFLFIIFKSLSVGSEFNLYYWIKYKKKYTDWYFEKETFKQYLNNGELKENDRKETCSTDFNER